MARYDSLRKLARNALLREYKASHPELSLKEIGKPFSISKQRVHQIISEGKNAD